jgi:ABC-type branched-subunit amino acid transport system permease subunit
VHVVTGGPFGLHGFGRFAGLPSEDLQQHGVISLIVLGFAATGIAAMLFFCEESNAGKAFRAIRKDPLLAQSQGINVSASKLCASGRSTPALAVPAYAPASTAR